MVDCFLKLDLENINKEIIFYFLIIYSPKNNFNDLRFIFKNIFVLIKII